jgi:hypothetical protein
MRNANQTTSKNQGLGKERMQHPNKKIRFIGAAILLLVCFMMAAVAPAQSTTTGKTVKCPEQIDTQKKALCPPAKSSGKSLCSVGSDCPVGPAPAICQPEYDCPSSVKAKPDKGK